MNFQNLKKTIEETYSINKDKYYGDDIINTYFLSLELYKKSNENLLILTKNNYTATKIYNLLANEVNNKDVILFPSEELLRVEYISQSKEILAEQIYALKECMNAKHKIVVASIQSAFRFLPSKKTFENSFIKIKKNDEINLSKLREILTKSGYYKVNKIDQSLQFASRGDILDIYTLNYDNPIRLEFFGDTVDSIRFFNVSDQSSIEFIDEVEILPGSINLLSENELENAKEIIEKLYKNDFKKAKNLGVQNELDNTFSKCMTMIDNNVFDNKFYKFMGVLQGFYSNLGDFLDNFNCILVGKSDLENTKETMINDSQNFLDELAELGKSFYGLKYYDESNFSLKNALKIYEIEDKFVGSDSLNLRIKTPSFKASKESTSSNIFTSYKLNNIQVICFIDDKVNYLKTKELLNLLDLKFKEENSYDFELEDYDVILVNKDIPFGFEFDKFAFITSSELYGITRHKSTYKTIFKEGTILSSYEELNVGDYVVHESYGIGQYTGITTITLSNIHQDYMEIHYANDEKLFVPLYQFNLVRKYVGREGRKPNVSKLSTNQWEKTKKKIKERVNELADRLLELYQTRSQIEGYSFNKDDDLQTIFENGFPYELTFDQKKALAEIKEDMEKPQPMDRLLCGDVGFGKTEIAFRAAFKALSSGKQVIMMCPTTLLAKQHYDLALERFKDFDFGIAMLSRLQKDSLNKEVIEGIKTGKYNFVIGTHKLLSNKIIYKDLGLLIIDEEQRFGVEQKEKIKENTHHIDVLTLSATPIPRTLQSTLVGLKTTSTINTPPKERMPIQTYVIPYQKAVIKEIIQKELNRNGQIFFVHNEIATIYERASDIQNLIPDCKIGVIHAKMEKDEIEDTMLSFYKGEIDLLVATSIIENGIDVRNANLIIIDNADKFGLAQLYQIKGRVGRGDRMAYAYLLVDENKVLNEDATKRLKAISEFTELGSGLKISQRDLLIRGAGDILGPEQAGFIDAIGIDMYIKILNETIDEKKKIVENRRVFKVSNVNVDGYIPSDFVSDENKIEIYQEIVNCKTIDELSLAKQRINDIYGKMPEEVETLLIKKKIDILINNEEFENINEFEKFIKVTLSKLFSQIEGIGTELFTALIPFIKNIKISYENRLINVVIFKNGDYIDMLVKILETINKIYNINKKVSDVDENR